MLTRAAAAAGERPASPVVTVTLDALSDDTFLQVLAVCGRRLLEAGQAADDGLPCFEAVKGLACSKGMLQQLRRLRPLVGVQSLAVVQRPAHGPWRVTLLYEGKLTEAVLEQAQQGHVHSIDAGRQGLVWLAPGVAERVVPVLLGAGCSLLELNLSFAQLNGTWAAALGEATVCSAVLRKLRLQGCRLQGPLPELRLPALRELHLNNNQFVGSLEPLQGCKALEKLNLRNNQVTGTLEPLRACMALRVLWLSDNRLTGSLESLRSYTALRALHLNNNQFTVGD